MCVPIYDLEHRPMSLPIHNEHQLILPENTAFIDRFGRLYHLPALRGLLDRNLRTSLRRRNICLNRIDDHIKPF